MSQLSIAICIKIDMIQALAAEAEDGPWYLTGTVEAGDVLGAWQAKGADDYAASLVNLNDPGTLDLTEIADTVPWSVEAGWLMDGDNFLDTGVATSGTVDHTYVLRFRRPNHGAASSAIFGDTVLDLHAFINRSGQSEFEIIHLGTEVVWDMGVDDASDPEHDWVIVMAGDKIYGNGVLIGTVAGYGLVEGSQSIALGGMPLLGGATIDIYASAFYNRKLNETEALAITSQIQAL